MSNELDRLNTSIKRIEREIEETKKWFSGSERDCILAGHYEELKEIQSKIAELS